MRKLFSIIIAIIIFGVHNIGVFAISPIETPETAITRLMENIKNPAVSAILPDNARENGIVNAVYEIAVSQVLSRLEYEPGNSKITGNRAVIDISVTAADISEPLEEIIPQVITYAALQKLIALPVSTEDFALGRLSEALDSENLTTIRTDTSVYLSLGGDGKWSIDVSDTRNLGFLRAISPSMRENSIFNKSVS